LELEKYRYRLESLVKERTKELERSNRQLQFSTAQLKRSNEALDEFVAIASHDLKEPLRKISMFGEYIQTRSEHMDEKCKNYFNRMITASERMAQFIDDLLEYSRLNNQPKSFHKINLKTIIQDVLIDLESRIIKTNAIINIEDIPPVEADPIQMRQLFLNLLSNSLKFSIKGVAPEIRIEAKKTLGGVVEIKVIDNGIGFEQKDSERIFTPFERLHARNEYEGTGIGLAFCNKIVLRHKGDISANSSEGEGTCIHIKLPSQQTSRTSQEEGNQKVIAFDSNPTNHL
jgi:light-regulated signal transduction histidine kinase (bacteriophytochrome)